MQGLNDRAIQSIHLSTVELTLPIPAVFGIRLTDLSALCKLTTQHHPGMLKPCEIVSPIRLPPLPYENSHYPPISSKAECVVYHLSNKYAPSLRWHSWLPPTATAAQPASAQSALSVLKIWNRLIRIWLLPCTSARYSDFVSARICGRAGCLMHQLSRTPASGFKVQPDLSLSIIYQALKSTYALFQNSIL